MKVKYIVFGVLFCIMMCLVSCDRMSDKESGDILKDTIISDESKTQPDEDKDDTEVPDAEVQSESFVIHVLSGYHYETNWNDEMNIFLSSVKYPEVHLNSCCKQAYPDLEKSLSDLNTANSKKILDEYAQLSEDALPEAKENADSFETYRIFEEVHVRRADSSVLSLLYSDSYYAGGSHGSYYKTGITFDTQTGKKLSLTDVVTDINAISENIKTQLYSKHSSDEFYADFDFTSYFIENYDNITWVLDYHGITFFFDPYEIGPYSTGIVTVTVANSEYPNAIKQNYQNIPEDYAVELSLSDDVYYDVDGNGFGDDIYITAHISENDMYEKYIISINDNRSEVSDYAYGIKPVLVHASDKNYLYVQITRENDWRELIVYDISSGQAINKNTIIAGWASEVIDTEEYLVLEQVMTDPNSFALETRTNVLSTVQGTKNYWISDSGLPETNDTYYTLKSEYVFTLLQPLEVSIVNDATGNTAGKMMLQEGLEVTYLRTDNETFADFELVNGTIVRVDVEYGEWPTTINGVDINEIFDGLMFAG